MATSVANQRVEKPVRIDIPQGQIDGVVTIPPEATGMVIFAHGSGSSRHSPRNKFVAETLQQAGLATLLIDLLTPGEERRDRVTTEHRFDIRLLANRLIHATDWVNEIYPDRGFHLGYFGASTGAAAALVAAAVRDDIVAVVSRGGRPDMAGRALEQVRAATLLVVGGWDDVVIDLNDDAFLRLQSAAHKRIQIIPHATHLFEEPGALEQVAELASEWFARFLDPDRREHIVET